jgi:hypothetical protein
MPVMAMPDKPTLAQAGAAMLLAECAKTAPSLLGRTPQAGFALLLVGSVIGNKIPGDVACDIANAAALLLDALRQTGEDFDNLLVCELEKRRGGACGPVGIEEADR